MTTRAMGPMAGLRWLTRALNVGGNRPGAVFGGAALLTIVVAAVAIGATALQLALVTALGDSMGLMILTMLLVGVLMIVLMAMLLVGFLRLIHKAENGGPARALDVFGGFGDFAASLRAIGFMVLLAVVQNLIIGVLLVVFAGDFMSWYLGVIQTSMAGGAPPDMTSIPGGSGIATLLMMVVGLLFYGIQAIGLCQIALRRRGLFGALLDGLVGSIKNLLPLVVFTIACVIALLVLGIAVFLVALVVGLVGKFVGMWLAAALAIPLGVFAMLVMYIVMFSAMYHLWRDVCSGGADAGPEASLDATDTEAVVA